MYDIDVLGVQGVNFTRSISETILPLFLSYSFLSPSLLFGIKIYKTFYRSSIINARLLPDLTLVVIYGHEFPKS